MLQFFWVDILIHYLYFNINKHLVSEYILLTKLMLLTNIVTSMTALNNNWFHIVSQITNQWVFFFIQSTGQTNVSYANMANMLKFSMRGRIFYFSAKPSMM